MISAKLAVLIATMAVIGAGAIPMAPMALSQEQEAEVEVERNNEISQSIEQSQEACTNEAEVEVSDDDAIDIGGENEAEVEQVNICDVTQAQSAANVATIDDDSENTFDIQGSIIGCPAEFENCSTGGTGQAICANVVSPSLQELCNAVFRG
jgi:hypothetical protein